MISCDPEFIFFSFASWYRPKQFPGCYIFAKKLWSVISFNIQLTLTAHSDESGLYCYAQFDTISTLTQESYTKNQVLDTEIKTYFSSIKSRHIDIVTICQNKIVQLSKSRRRQNKIVRTSWETKCQQIDQTRTSAWTNWSDCDITCNQNNEFVTGKRERTRYCIKV